MRFDDSFMSGSVTCTPMPPIVGAGKVIAELMMIMLQISSSSHLGEVIRNISISCIHHLQNDMHVLVDLQERS